METRQSQLNISEASYEDLLAMVAVEETVSRAKYPNASLGISMHDIESIGWGEGRAAKYRERYLANPYGNMWVAKLGHEVVGFCAAVKEDQANRLGKLYVRGELQRQGVGRRLLETAEVWLGGGKEIWLGVASFDRPALRFYMKHGYVPRGSRLAEHTTIPTTGAVIPETLMIKPY